MTLQELFAEHQKRVLIAIGIAHKCLEERHQARAAAVDRAREARQKTGQLRARAETKSREANTLEAQITELERQANDLRRRLAERNADLRSAQAEIGKMNTEATGHRKEERELLAEVELIEGAIHEDENRLALEQARLAQVPQEALDVYLDYLWRRLLDHTQGVSRINAARDLRTRFDKARAASAEIAAQWEAREEWKRIAEASGPLVKMSAQKEQANLEAGLEKIFPGLLESLSMDVTGTETEELHYDLSLGEGVALPLPIPAKVWRSVAQGGADWPEGLAMRIVWAMARRFPPSVTDSTVENGERPLVRIQLPAAEVERCDPPEVELQQGGSVNLFISPMPVVSAEAAR